MLIRSLTDYLCAAGFLDASFRSQVLRSYLKEPFRTLSPSPGVQADKILASCIEAERLEKIKDLVFSVLLMICFLVSLYSLKSDQHSLFPSPAVTIYKTAPSSNAIMYLAAIVMLIHATRQHVFGMWHLLNFSIIQNLFTTALLVVIFLSTIRAGTAWMWGMFIFAVGIYEYIKYGVMQKAICNFAKNGDFQPSKIVQQNWSAIEYARDVENGNIIIYNGISPYEYCGWSFSGWAISIPLTSNSKNIAPATPFSKPELYSYLSGLVRDAEIPNISTPKAMYFVHSADLQKTPFLPDPPRRPRPQLIEENPSKSLEPVFLCPPDKVRDAAQIQYLSEDLAITAFVSVQSIGKQHLSIETEYRVLPFLDERYCQFVNSIRPIRSWYEVFGSISVSTAVTAVRIARSPISMALRVLERIYEWISFHEDYRRIKCQDPTFDYGALPNIRQLMGIHEYRRLDQATEADIFRKTINNIIIEGAKTFLESKNIDTSIFQYSRESIVNYGIIISDGDVKAQNLAIGKKASAISKVIPKQKKKKRARY